MDGFNGIPNQPIIPPVNNKGTKLGSMEITTIRHERNRIAIKIPMVKTANNRLVIKFFAKYCVPSEATTDVPVIVTSKYSLSIAFRKLLLKSFDLYDFLIRSGSISNANCLSEFPLLKTSVKAL